MYLKVLQESGGLFLELMNSLHWVCLFTVFRGIQTFQLNLFTDSQDL